ncbi:MAG: hypothetical protein AB9903_21885 [Vulcanimicrobiota bacterium]
MEKVRTQIQLERHQYERLKEEAYLRRQSLSGIIRMMIDKGLEAMGGEKDMKKAFSFVGSIPEDKSDVAEHHDDYLGDSVKGLTRK